MSTSESVRFATWNLRWARTTSAATPTIRKRLAEVAPDVAVLTEATLSMLRDDWSHIEHGGVATYPNTPDDGAKVAIVSTSPIEVVDRVGSPALPTGNFLAVDVDTPSGPLRVIGIVVRYNQKAAYVDALPAALERTVTDRTVLAGDFNMKIPASGLAKRLYGVLSSFGLSIHTGGPHPALAAERPLIDHIATTDHLETGDIHVWRRLDPHYRDGTTEVSDHAGVALSLHL